MNPSPERPKKLRKWPISKRFWHFIHMVVNRLAWRFADPGGEDWGKALRIDNTRILWRLNHFAAKRWSNWWIQQKVEKHRSIESNRRP